MAWTPPPDRARRRAQARARRLRLRRRRIAAALLVAIALGALAVALGDAGGHGKGSTSARTAAGRAREGRAAGSAGSTRSPAAGGAAASGGGAASGPASGATVSGAAAAGAAASGGAAGGAEDVETPTIQHLIALGKPIYCAAPHGDEVALTFDDGPGQYTYLALPKLRKHSIKATFFIVGRNIPLGPQYLRQERALGAVGDHTFTHPLLTGLAPEEAQAQIVRTQQAVAQAAGSQVFLFRPPYGGRNATIDSIARAHGLLEIMWTVDSRDSLGANYAEIERNVIEGLRPGSIILMHENHGQTIRAMLGIFAAIQRKHLRTVSVPRLLTDDPPSDEQVRAGGAGCGSLFHAGTGSG